jgi:hypothetical protein
MDCQKKKKRKEKPDVFTINIFMECSIHLLLRLFYSINVITMQHKKLKAKLSRYRHGQTVRAPRVWDSALEIGRIFRPTHWLLPPPLPRRPVSYSWFSFLLETGNIKSIKNSMGSIWNRNHELQFLVSASTNQFPRKSVWRVRRTLTSDYFISTPVVT